MHHTPRSPASASALAVLAAPAPLAKLTRAAAALVLAAAGSFGPWSAAPARAHTVRPLDTTGLAAAAPGGPGSNLRLIGLTNGAAVSRDGGGLYTWICEEALVGPLWDEARLGVTRAGSLLLGDGNTGLLRSQDAGCSWQPSGAFAAPHSLTDLAIWPAAGDDAWVVISNATADGHGSVWLTVDGGHSYRRLGFAVRGAYLTGVAVVDDAVVVTGTNNRARGSALLYVSRDRGVSWQGGVLAFAPDITAEARVFSLGGGRVAVTALDAVTNVTTVALAGQVAGPYHVVQQVAEPIRGVVADDAGQVVAVASSHRLLVSHDGGAHFALAERPRGNGCVQRVGEQLLTCGSVAEGDGFSLATFAVSQGKTQLSPHFRFSALRGPYHCPEGTPVRELCLPLWQQAAQRFGASAAPPKQAARANGGEGCQAGRQASSGAEAAGHAAALAVTWWVLRGPGRATPRRR